MRQIILNLNSTDNRLYYQDLIRQGENKASEIIINLSDEFKGYKYLIKFKNNENLEVITPELVVVDNQIKYIITNVLTKDAGTLKVELNAYEETGMLRKTAITMLRVIDALGDTCDVMPEEYVPWFVRATEQASIATQKAQEINNRLDSLNITTWQSLLNIGGAK